MALSTYSWWWPWVPFWRCDGPVVLVSRIEEQKVRLGGSEFGSVARLRVGHASRYVDASAKNTSRTLGIANSNTKHVMRQ